MADELRSLSEELASDPGSFAFLRLGELLRQRGDLDAAERVAQRGRERHPGLAAAHDLVARIALDRADAVTAVDAWRTVLQLDPGHASAHKGLGFIAYRDGRLQEAAGHLSNAAAADRYDQSIAAALATVTEALREDVPARPAVSPSSVTQRRSNVGASLFADLAADAETVLLVDKDGLVLAATSPAETAAKTEATGAHLSGVSEEADRAMRHLDLGAWTSIVIEAPLACASLSPAGDGGVVMVTAPRSTPLGLLKRLAERATERARTWLGDA